jgi:LysM repeat protein
MNHRRRRISRVLLGVLAVTIAAGLFTYVRRLSSTKANEAVASAAATNPAEPVQPAIPAVVGDKPVEPVKQSLPQQPPGPFRTETPTAFVTPTPAGAGPSQSTATQLTTPPGAAATTQVAAGLTSGFAKPAMAAPAADPSKVSIKPYQPPAGSHPIGGNAGELLGQARAQMQVGKLLEARDAANAAIVSGRLKGADADAARALLSEINQTVVFSTRKFADDRFGGTYQVQSGDRLGRIGARYAITADMLMRINGLADDRRLRAGAYIKVLKGPFHAVVSKGSFRLDLYLGGLPGQSAGPDVAYVTSFPVGLGKDDSTPLGKWQVEPDRKVKNPVYYSPRGEGVIEADDPKNPLGEFWIGLAGLEGDALGKESYGIHGTIEPDSIGKQASMGCIRLRNDDIAVVFAALVEGKSTILITE